MHLKSGDAIGRLRGGRLKPDDEDPAHPERLQAAQYGKHH
jgi:hypothetical protein